MGGVCVRGTCESGLSNTRGGSDGMLALLEDDNYQFPNNVSDN